MPARSSDERSGAALESCTEVVGLLDREGQVLTINPALGRLLGRDARELEGHNFLEIVATEDRAAFTRLLHASVAGEPPPAEPLEIDCRHSNGARRIFEVALVNRLDDARLQAVVCSAWDVTERDRTQARLLAQDRIGSVGLLAAGVAHEINNPLAAIVASLELAANRLVGTARGGIPGPVHAAELGEDIRAAREATERVRQIVRDLKVLARSEEDRRSVIDLEKLLDTSARLASAEIRPRARLIKNYGRVPPVYANESRLGQAFLNLLIHAARALPEGRSGDHFIELTTSVDERGFILVELADSGDPVPEELRERLFAPFVTTRGGASNLGLELTVCQRIVEDLGGEIGYQNPAGRGNVFRISLPPTGKVPKREQYGDSDSGLHNLPRRGKVLVIDDEPTINSAIARALSIEHEVVTVTRAGEALVRLRGGERFDVIFCDLMMPQMSGMDLHRELLAELPDQAGRMVFLTGGAFTGSARRFLEEVPNLRIEKPFDTRLLRTIVNDRLP